MHPKRFVILTALVTAVETCGPGAMIASATISIPTVLVGDPGNFPLTTIICDGGCGSVSYLYNIGTYEITAGQYTAFLNAVASESDPNNLYNVNMSNVSYGSGISRILIPPPGMFRYVVDARFVNRPVNYVSFWDACRFANWLHNGQPVGLQSAVTTEDGAYTLTTAGISNNTVTRNAGWRWAVTSEDEWFKAAYYQPANMGGDYDNYWLYPTRSNSAPGRSLSDPLGNNANYWDDSVAGDPGPIQSPYYTTIVGEFQYSHSFYGTFDQGGNVFEWTEKTFGFYTEYRGGAFNTRATGLESSDGFGVYYPDWEAKEIGFRIVASLGCQNADLNGNGSVTVADLFEFLDVWFGQFGQSGSGLAADFDGNGSVAVSDLFGYLDTWFEYFGTTC